MFLETNAKILSVLEHYHIHVSTASDVLNEKKCFKMQSTKHEAFRSKKVAGLDPHSSPRLLIVLLEVYAIFQAEAKWGHRDRETSEHTGDIISPRKYEQCHSGILSDISELDYQTVAT